MQNVLFENVTIVDSGSSQNGELADVWVEGGRIARISPARTLRSQTDPETTVLIGGFLSPGWVDMRCQLSDPGYEWREDLRTLSAAALAGGFTRLLVQPNSHPVMDNAGQVQALQARAMELPIYLHVAGALSEGTLGKDMAELFDMHRSGALAFTDGSKGTQSAALLLRGLQYVLPFDGLVIDSPMDRLLAEDGMVADGVSAVRMGLKGIPALAEEAAVERDLRLLEHFPGRLHIGPVTTGGALERLSIARGAGVKFTLETSALYLMLDATENEAFDAVTKVFPPLRDKASVAALRKAVAQGMIDVITSGHHPQGREDKTHDFVDASFGADALETAFAAIMTGMDSEPQALGSVIRAISTTPRQILRLAPCTISEGMEAELTHFDPAATWVPQLSDIHSKSKYNPLLGREMKGRVLGTYVKGQWHPHR
ncbi:MAG: hypothetical protein RLZZ165_2339 [Bacteroidota bacterium]|jgi:dihydroorotase